MDEGVARLVTERDLYRRCLDLCSCDDPAPLLTRTVRLLTELVGAERGYIEISDITSSSERCWWAEVGVDDQDLEQIRDRISRGIVAEAIESGESVHLPDALLDQRFGERESVRRSKIQAVLCVPLQAEGISGVVYLQNHASDGQRGGLFSPNDVQCVEQVARLVGSKAGPLLELIRRRNGDDATKAIRQRMRLGGVIGRSRALADLLDRIGIVASMHSHALFVGPNGTGKSMLAQILHDNSPRATGPFVELNCAALPATLAESELFGADRGAFTGAPHQGLEGKVSAAEGGTLFLDEIGDLDLTIQAKLLQFLQSKQYRRLGGTKVFTANVRIISATNQDLEQLISDGRFREDLYYRLRGILLQVPSLAERSDDIPLLASHFVADACRQNQLPPMEISPTALAAVAVNELPGNVRQLAGLCNDAVVEARIDGSPIVEVRHFFPERVAGTDSGHQTFQQFRDARDRAFLSQSLRARDWNVTRTARELEISRAHLNALIRRFGLSRSGE